jgi:hypothetical protein
MSFRIRKNFCFQWVEIAVWPIRPLPWNGLSHFTAVDSLPRDGRVRKG